MNPETKFKMRVQKILKDRYGLGIFFFKTQEKSVRGIPDIVGCLNGKFFAIELKTRTGTPSKLQLHIIRSIQKTGGLAMVVDEDNLNIFLDCLDGLKYL
jgi:Holliday junction resolvase